jgi:hypothetical protein
MSTFDYDARPVTPGVILVGTIGAELGQGQAVMIGAVAAEQRGLSRNRRRPSAHSVPRASDVLPDPDTPATATVRHSGTSASISRRLSCWAALARRTGATVIGLASQSNHQWLKSHGVIPVAYGDGAADRIRAAAPGGVDAFIDTYGDGYVELALALGVAAERIDTIADYAASAQHGVKTDGGQRPGRAPRCSPSWPA